MAAFAAKKFFAISWAYKIYKIHNNNNMFQQIFKNAIYTIGEFFKMHFIITKPASQWVFTSAIEKFYILLNKW